MIYKPSPSACYCCAKWDVTAGAIVDARIPAKEEQIAEFQIARGSRMFFSAGAPIVSV
jgi:hypothetical protein